MSTHNLDDAEQVEAERDTWWREWDEDHRSFRLSWGSRLAALFTGRVYEVIADAPPVLVRGEPGLWASLDYDTLARSRADAYAPRPLLRLAYPEKRGSKETA